MDPPTHHASSPRSPTRSSSCAWPRWAAQILPARLTTDEGVKELARRPVGTGAYKFVEWVKDERLVMEAQQGLVGLGGQAARRSTGVIWKPIPDDFPRLVALEKGEVDIITNVPPTGRRASRTVATRAS